MDPNTADSLSSEPEADLCKEVYAYFGLCMAISQTFETHLINTLTVYTTHIDPIPTRQTYDRHYAEHQKLTFGNLVKRLSTYSHFSHLESEVVSMKSDRDFLAHRFFRDRAEEFITRGGCLALIKDLDQFRLRFEDIDRRVCALESTITTKLGFHTKEFEAKCAVELARMIENAQAKYS